MPFSTLSWDHWSNPSISQEVSIEQKHPESLLLIQKELLTASASFTFHTAGGTSLLRNSAPALDPKKRRAFTCWKALLARERSLMLGHLQQAVELP